MVTPDAFESEMRGADHETSASVLIEAVLNEALVCTVVFSLNDSLESLTTGFGVVDEVLFIHGGAASLGGIKGDSSAAVVVVTVIDGIVLGRSERHHSLNSRSVEMRGRLELVTEPAAKRKALRSILDHTVPGRSGEGLRPATPEELERTVVAALRPETRRLKCRVGPPKSLSGDETFGAWSGVLPVSTVFGVPIPGPLEERWPSATLPPSRVGPVRR